MTKEEQEKAKQKEEKKKHWLSIEAERKSREKYEMKEFSGWMYFGPCIGLIIAAVAGFLIWASGSENAGSLWWVVGISLAPLILLGFTSDFDDEWKVSCEAKYELQEKKGKRNFDDENPFNFEFGSYQLNGFNYKNGYIYTDSIFSYWLYTLAKFVSSLSSIIFGIGAIILGFMWLGSISIAPTTIIIILLIIIIMNQNRGK